MKRFALPGIAIAALIAPTQVQSQQYDAQAGCVRFPQKANPEAETRYLLSNPNVRVCPGRSPDPAGQAETVRRGMDEGYSDTMQQIRANRGY